jgi:hypothetical protein
MAINQRLLLNENPLESKMDYLKPVGVTRFVKWTLSTQNTAPAVEIRQAL